MITPSSVCALLRRLHSLLFALESYLKCFATTRDFQSRLEHPHLFSSTSLFPKQQHGFRQTTPNTRSATEAMATDDWKSHRDPVWGYDEQTSTWQHDYEMNLYALVIIPFIVYVVMQITTYGVEVSLTVSALLALG